MYEDSLNDWMDEILSPNSNPLMTDAVSHANIPDQSCIDNIKTSNDSVDESFSQENQFILSNDSYEETTIQTNAYNNDDITVELNVPDKKIRQEDLLTSNNSAYKSTLHRFHPYGMHSSSSRNNDKLKYLIHPLNDRTVINPSQTDVQTIEINEIPCLNNDSTISFYEGVSSIPINSTTTQIYQFLPEDGIDSSVDSFPLTPPGSNNSSDNDVHISSNVNYGYAIDFTGPTSSNPIRRPRPRIYDNCAMKSEERFLLGNSYLHRSSDVLRQSRRFSDCFQTSDIQHGTLILTEDEKRALLAEGYTIPSRLPLTKIEERNLKKIRRKIKNKISAQESRRKKKEYMEILEKKVEVYEQENHELRYRLDHLESSNRSLLSQLRHLQQTVNRSGLSATLPNASFSSVMVNSQESHLHSSSTDRSGASQHSTCTNSSNSISGTPFMALFLCFALMFTGVAPPLSSMNGNKQAITSCMPQSGISVPSLSALSYAYHKEENLVRVYHQQNSNKIINMNTTRPYLPFLESGKVEDIASATSKNWCSKSNCVTLPRIEDQLGRSRLLDISEESGLVNIPGPHNIWWFITGRNQYYAAPVVEEEEEEEDVSTMLAPPLPSDYLKNLLNLSERQNCSTSCLVTTASNVTGLI